MQSPPSAQDLQLLEAARKDDHNTAISLLRDGASPSVKHDPDGHTALHAAAEYGSLEVAKALLQQGSLVNTLTSNNSTALNLAAHHGHVDIMDVLLAAHADVNIADSYGLTALHKACSSGKPAAAELLVANGASLEAACAKGHTALHYASQKGCLEALQVLLRAGASLTAVTSLHCETPLHLAAAGRNHKEVVQLLLSSGAQPQAKDARGSMALHTASEAGHEGVMECLLGADSTAAHVNALGPDGGGGGGAGAPLHIACLQGHSRVVRLLIKVGADVNARSAEERTPLHQAAIGGHSLVLKQLLAAGANPGALTRTGALGLHIAAMRGHLSVLKQLLAAMAAAPGGVPLDALYHGITPLQWAVECGRAGCLKALLAAGGDPDALYGAEAQFTHGAHVAGASTLHRAVTCNNVAAVPLLATPANMAHVWEGKTPLHLALHLGHDSWWRPPGMVQALVEAGSPAGVADADGVTAMSAAACSTHSDYQALLPAMVQRECEAYKQLQQQRGVGGQQQPQQQQDQELTAVLTAVVDAVSALLEGSAACATSKASDICMSCIQGVLEALGGAAGSRLMQQVLRKCIAADAAAAAAAVSAAEEVAAAAAPAAVAADVAGAAANVAAAGAGDDVAGAAGGDAGAAVAAAVADAAEEAKAPMDDAADMEAAAGQHCTAQLVQALGKGLSAALEPQMQQRQRMIHRLQQLVTQPFPQQEATTPQQEHGMAAAGGAGEQEAVAGKQLSAQAMAAAQAGGWQQFVQLWEQVLQLQPSMAGSLLGDAVRQQKKGTSMGVEGLCEALLGAWQQVPGRMQQELAEAVVSVVQAAEQRQVVAGSKLLQRGS